MSHPKKNPFKNYLNSIVWLIMSHLIICFIYWLKVIILTKTYRKKLMFFWNFFLSFESNTCVYFHGNMNSEMAYTTAEVKIFRWNSTPNKCSTSFRHHTEAEYLIKLVTCFTLEIYIKIYPYLFDRVGLLF